MAIPDWIATYFPAEAQDDAACITTAVGLDAGAVVDVSGPSPCPRGPISGPTTASGLFGILESCWSPAVQGDNTPFTVQDWDRRLDPEANVWMASVVWSIGGWRAWPEACLACGNCQVTGMPIPHPRNPSKVRGLQAPPSSLVGVVAAVGILGGLFGLAHLERTGRLW